jgi:YafQ family addiction module toxin component
MSYKAIFSKKLIKIIQKISKKDPKLSIILNKKIKEIKNIDSKYIDHYKNLRYDLKDYKRLHIQKCFVLIFSVDRKKNIIYFVRFDHHDNIYR